MKNLTTGLSSLVSEAGSVTHNSGDSSPLYFAGGLTRTATRTRAAKGGKDRRLGLLAGLLVADTFRSSMMKRNRRLSCYLSFARTTKQTELYDEALHPWMASFLQGFNVTVIAYGQTGSGKTYTMGNSMPSTSVMANSLFARSPSTDDSSDEEAADTLDSDEGLIPRFLHHLFTKLNENGSDYQLSVSFLEIYGEEIHDLLESPEAQRSNRCSEPLQLRENKKNGVWVQGLTEVRVSNRQEAMEQMRKGSLQRITASTQMNERSSRSHAVYTVKIVQRVSEQDPKKNVPVPNNQEISHVRRRDKIAFESSNNEGVGSEASEPDTVIVAKLTFVDLAGSERLKKTQAEGERMKEGIQINVGLFALGNVINALGDEKRRAATHAHVPYRSSKLTRLLQDALGGNSRTLFIACVSPADINANETLNTLQYANRAKNIQNKAVKNVDSRTAELVNLKAFNQLLCHELVKALVTGLGSGDPVGVDKLTEACMTNPKVLGYLSRIEQLAVSAGVESSSDERVFEIRRLLDGLSAYLNELVPDRGYRRAASQASLKEDETKSIDANDEFMDLISDSGSSIVLMEEQKPEMDEVFVTPYPLGKLCRTLEVMNLAFELQELHQVEKRQWESSKAKIINLENRIHRYELLRNGMSDTIKRMQTWLSSQTLNVESEKKRSMERNVEQAVEKLELMDIDVEEMQRQKAAMDQNLEMEIERCQNEWKKKHEQIEKLREAPEDATTNALNVLTRRTEIKVRFDGYDLDSILSYLKDEEREMATFIDEDDGAISFMSPLFTKEELSSAQSREILSMIQDQLRIAFDKEALEASMNKELRKRAQLFRSITSGLLACQSGDMSEKQFMEKNEQNLRDCEDAISQIRDAMRSKRGQRASIAGILDSITSLDAAKDVIRRLIVEIYSYWRIYMVFDEEENMRQQKEAEETLNQRLAVIKAEMDKKTEELEAKYEKDVQCAFEMVTNFNDVINSGEQSQTQEVSVAAETGGKIAALEERERALEAQLADRDEELARMRSELERSQASAKKIWQELGLNEKDQAIKFQDINALLVKKCSEELESLEAAREKLQGRIDDAYRAVRKLESILHVNDRVSIETLGPIAGTTLLEQEAYLLALQKRLSKDLLHRINSCARTVEGIQELAIGLRIRSISDFHHVAHNEVGSIDEVLARLLAADLSIWKHYQHNPESASALEQLCGTFDETTSTSISNYAMQQNDLLLSVLLKEKTRRITELEESLEAIRIVARTAQLSHEDIESVVHAICTVKDVERDEEDRVDIHEELSAWILQTGGQLDVSKRGLDLLSKVRRGFEEVYAGRSNALEFLHRTLEEGAMLSQDQAAGDPSEGDGYQRFPFSLPQVQLNLEGNMCFVDTLAAGKKMLTGLSEPVNTSLRSLFYSMNDEFAAFGIDTEDQRISFFLGCMDEGHEARRAIIEKYAVLPSNSSDVLNDQETETLEKFLNCNDSFLSKLDPAFEEFRWVYSMSFGELQLQRLRNAIADMGEVISTVKSAQNRLRSLQKIMKIFNKINEFKTKIAEFEESASQKDRLFGNSLRLLEEERFRKMAAKHYPNLLASLRKEVTRWLENEDGEYDLGILGEDLKNLLLDMMNTDTGLMHLDLGTVRRPTKPSLTPNSSSSNLQATASSSGQRASTPARTRTQSLNARAHSART
ncbi:unnamed protein product [Phytophthora lilii]|uniref:Unnamed protein product n=1 Tax=Phytophthora lilii TaxID=2077276 RepID=A0A9W6U8V1_9STRA|nr:unnamed protein product [Phytophthora lilii]